MTSKVKQRTKSKELAELLGEPYEVDELDEPYVLILHPTTCAISEL